MVNYIGSGGAVYHDMKSISFAFGFMALVFLAAGIACFFSNKVYHSINVTIYFLKRRGRKSVPKSKKKKACLLGLLFLISLSAGGKEADGREKTTLSFCNESAGVMDTTEKEEEAGRDDDIPQLFVETEANLILDEETSDLLLTDQEGGSIRILLSEMNYLSHTGQERGDIRVNIEEEGNRSVKIYDWESLVPDGQGLWALDIPLEGRKNLEIRYQIIFEYQDQEGHYLQAGEKRLNQFGRVSEGRFESFWFVIDNQAPRMSPEIRLQGKSCLLENKEIIVGDDHVTGKIEILENHLNLSKIVFEARPLDAAARKSARASEHILPDGNLDIPVYTANRVGDVVEIKAHFGEEGRWQLLFSCGDRAGHEGRTDSGDTMISSPEFIVDQKSPAMRINYSPGTCIRRTRVGPEEVEGTLPGELPRVNVKDCQVFFPGNQDITLTIKEDYFDEKAVAFQLIKETWESEYGEGLNQKTASAPGHWKEEYIDNLENYMDIGEWEMVEESQYQTRINLKKEGNYHVVVQYKDLTGRRLEADNSGTENCALFIGEGQYQGPLITVDRTAPTIVFALCESEKGPALAKSAKSDYLFLDQPRVIVRIADENFCGGELLMSDRVFYADGREKEGVQKDMVSGKGAQGGWKRIINEEGYVYETSFSVPIEGNHEFSFSYVDAAGHSSEKKGLKLTYDCQGPVVEYERIDDWQGEPVDIREQEAEGIFSGKGIRIKIRITDPVSGIDNLWYRFSGTYCDEEGRIYSKIPEFRKLETGSEGDGPLTDWIFFLEPDKENFIGRLELYSQDCSGNYSDLVKSREIAGETDWLHENKSHIKWAVAGAASVNEKDKIMYFNGEGSVKVRFIDDWSGVAAWTFLVSDKNLSVKEILDSCKKVQKKGPVSSLEKEFTLKGEAYEDSCPDHSVFLYAAFIDRAGHYKISVYEEYRIVMDQKKPTVNIVYDRTENGKYGLYFSKPRKATVTVSDINFNPESVVWNIKGTAGGWELGPWTGKDGVSTCDVYFSKDGSGYNISVKGSDYSGNTFSWDKDRSFVIDQTAPEIKIIMAGEEDKHNGKYYPSEKKLLVRIKENNLENGDIIIRKQSSSEEKNPEGPELLRGPLKKENGYYYVELAAVREGVYKPEIVCQDLAGNKSAVASLEEFVIDKTAPYVTIKGLQEGETLVGELSCKADCRDRNLDLKSLKFEIYSLSGKKIEDSMLSSELRIDSEKGAVSRAVKSWKDSPGLSLEDGVYRIHIKGKDLAGNSLAGKTGFLFFVNRTGAAYMLQKASRDRIKTGYLLGTGGLCIEEYSVSPTVTTVKIIRDNQDQYKLSSDDYRLTTEVIPAGEGLYSGWIKKIIRLPARLFEEEGCYRVLLKTKAMDTAGRPGKVINQTDNEIKGQELSFIVDKTPPRVHLGGLDKDIYEEKEHTFRLTVMDNIALDKIELSVEKGIFKKRSEVRVIYPGELDAMNSILLKLKAYGGYQTIRYMARDKAGNTIYSDDCKDTRSCLVAGIAGRSEHPATVLPEDQGEKTDKKKLLEDRGMDLFPTLFGAMVSVLVLAGSVLFMRDREAMQIKGERIKNSRKDEEDVGFRNDADRVDGRRGPD